MIQRFLIEASDLILW